ncbi:MAG: dTMP kinase [Coriobacteriales bacterium]|jgi:dTMP kinase|nr:dTMP kinase [Coriobacteriales bacterium]
MQQDAINSFDSADTPSTGLFITFEGGEGVGKSTQIKLLAARLEAAGMEVLRLREPGGTSIGETIRGILLDPANTAIESVTELLLYEAARSQLVGQIIKPALARGVTVLCDRYTDSTLAYQGVARGLGLELVQRANNLGSLGLVPHRTIVLEHDLLSSLGRATQNGADRLEAESLDFHTKVQQGFEQLAANEPQRVRRVQSCAQKADTATAVFEQLVDLFPAVAELDFFITEELLQNIKNRPSYE